MSDFELTRDGAVGLLGCLVALHILLVRGHAVSEDSQRNKILPDEPDEPGYSIWTGKDTMIGWLPFDIQLRAKKFLKKHLKKSEQLVWIDRPALGPSTLAATMKAVILALVFGPVFTGYHLFVTRDELPLVVDLFLAVILIVLDRGHARHIAKRRDSLYIITDKRVISSLGSWTGRHNRSWTYKSLAPLNLDTSLKPGAKNHYRGTVLFAPKKEGVWSYHQKPVYGFKHVRWAKRVSETIQRHYDQAEIPEERRNLAPPAPKPKKIKKHKEPKPKKEKKPKKSKEEAAATEEEAAAGVGGDAENVSDEGGKKKKGKKRRKSKTRKAESDEIEPPAALEPEPDPFGSVDAGAGGGSEGSQGSNEDMSGHSMASEGDTATEDLSGHSMSSVVTEDDFGDSTRLSAMIDPDDNGEREDSD